MSTTPRPRGVIVYLTQVKHASYRTRDSLGLLRTSLTTLVRNYLDEWRDDCLLLHNGDFDEATKASVLGPFRGLPISFRVIPDRYWHLPPWLNASEGPLESPRLEMRNWKSCSLRRPERRTNRWCVRGLCSTH